MAYEVKSESEEIWGKVTVIVIRNRAFMKELDSRKIKESVGQ